jgi:hypothetical protein
LFHVSNENGRGIALADLNNDDHLDIICGNWKGNHRIFLQLKAKSARHFRNVASAFFEHPSPIRTVIVADFDNDMRIIVSQNVVHENISLNIVVKVRNYNRPNWRWMFKECGGYISKMYVLSRMMLLYVEHS